LNDIALQAGYTWADPAKKLTVAQSSYAARYNADPANYNDFLLNITVNVAKANYTGIKHNVLVTTYTPTNTLNNVAGLQAGYSWIDPSQKLTVAQSNYAAQYNVDPSNYNDFLLNITVNVAKANYTGIKYDALSVIYTEISTLADITLHKDFTWTDPTEKLTATKNSYAAQYNADPANYNDFELDITVNKLFSIDVAQTINGKVKPFVIYQQDDVDVLLTIDPTEGYELDNIVVYKTGDETQIIPLQGGDINRIFRMPAFDVTISATFKVVTGINNPQLQSLRAFSKEGGLHIIGLVPGEVFGVYNMQGKLCYKGKAITNEQTVSLRDRGIYIVVAGEKRVKALY
jgi:hypothetical protein